MQGRYGVDRYSRFLNAFAVFLLILAIILRYFKIKTDVLILLALAVVLYSYWRTFSRQISKRSAEEAAFLRRTAGLRAFGTRIVQSKDYIFYKCEKCGKQLRLPRGKGKVKAKCPRCGHEMIKRT